MHQLCFAAESLFIAKEVKHWFGDRNINFVLISSWQNLQNFMLANKSLVNRRYFSLFFFSRVKSWSPIVWNTSKLWSGWVPYRNWLKMLRYQKMEILWILSLKYWVSFRLHAIIFIPQIFTWMNIFMVIYYHPNLYRHLIYIFH